MAFGDFTLKALEEQFQLTIEEHPDLFAGTTETAPSHLLQGLLKEYTPLALAINTEKARSEMLIAPILIEVRAQLEHRISLFSGIELSVDPDRGLNGVCDFILSRSPQQQFLETPAVAIIEAKNENLKSGLGQCVAAMLAAQLFNQNESRHGETIYGVVTTGSLWRFLRLRATTVTLDQQEYHLRQSGLILGILIGIMTRVD